MLVPGACALKVERDENDQRKEPTISEKVALAGAIAESLDGRVGRPNNSGNISGISETGDTRDIAAAKAGLGSGKTLEAAQVVIATGVPAVVDRVPRSHARPECALHPLPEQAHHRPHRRGAARRWVAPPTAPPCPHPERTQQLTCWRWIVEIDLHPPLHRTEKKKAR